jgi:cellobiose-specific phosphotransferase system component IIB
MKALIICQFAITSKNMISRIIQHAKETDSAIDVACASVSEIAELPFEDYDVVLLAPQVRNYLKTAEERCAPLHIPVSSIDVMAYGLQDAEKVLCQIKKLYQENGERG